MASAATSSSEKAPKPSRLATSQAARAMREGSRGGAVSRNRSPQPASAPLATRAGGARISAGSSRESSVAASAGRTDSVQTMPVEMSSQAAPRRSPPPSARASSQEGRPPSSRESSVTVPGVTMRTTSRRMVLALRALACSGVSIWSQSATR
ncbi:hypothetical protein ROTAS13_02675 [Roseomonas sp. TAS13]|nr:hypothetical protein ROTAS13_02675 [Roseomonas sp. TAS13]